VTFSASSGGIAVTQGTTDATGAATATLSTAGDSVTRTITVTATASGLTATVQVQVVPSSSATTSQVSQLTLSSNSPTILNDGSTTATITALARDANNNVIAGVPISFKASSDAIQANSSITDATGTVTATLSTGGNTAVQTVTVTGTTGSLSSTVNVGVVAPSTPTNPVYALGNGVGTCFVPKLIGGQITTGSCSAVLSSGNISAGGTTALSLTVVDQNDSLYISAPVTVTFSSPCIASGQAEILPNNSSTPETTITTTTGSINATYVANGCVGSDTIDATATVNGQSLLATGAVTVLAASAGSIQFVSATPTTIGLKGTGASPGETSVVVFKVLSSTGSPEPGQTVNFTINTSVGGLSFSPATATSAADGTVQTVVSSGTVHTSVRVTATVPASGSTPAITAQSSQLTITSGLPTSNGFGLAVGPATYPSTVGKVDFACPNIEAWSVLGVTVPYTVVLNDRYNNPVPDGTAVSFTTNASTIAGSCFTTSTLGNGGQGTAAASCSALWTSGTSPPYTLAANSETDNSSTTLVQDALDRYASGRGQVLAYAEGEESFTDLSGTGYYQVGDPFVELSEPFLDQNESGAFYSLTLNLNGTTFTEADRFIDFYGTGSYVPPSNTKPFVGITCSGGTTSDPATCSASTLEISTSRTIILSTSLAQIQWVTCNNSGCTPLNPETTSISLAGVNLTSPISVQVVDEHGNAMGAGTSVSFSVSNTTAASITATGGTVVGCDSNNYRNINTSYNSSTKVLTDNGVTVPNYNGEIFTATLTELAVGSGDVIVTVSSIGTGSTTYYSIPFVTN
jgi:hypothetical protein